MRLKRIHPALRPEARQRLNAGDVDGFFFTADSMDYMVLLGDNSHEFRERGLYERALLCAWSGQKSTVERFKDGSLFSWGRVVGSSLLKCDRTKLLAAGDPLPEGDTFTIYRGVWGETQQKEARGISWTLSLKVAQSFASPSCSGGGTVYTTQVKRADVFAYINESGRNEQEVLVVLPDEYPIEMVATYARRDI